MKNNEKELIRQMERMLFAFDSCNRFILYLDKEYKFAEEEKEMLHKLQYRYQNLYKDLKVIKEQQCK